MGDDMTSIGMFYEIEAQVPWARGGAVSAVQLSRDMPLHWPDSKFILASLSSLEI